MENNTNRPENIINSELNVPVQRTPEEEAAARRRILQEFRETIMPQYRLITEGFLRLDEPVRESKPILPDLRTPEEKAAARRRIGQELRETIVPQYRLLTEGEKE